VPTGAEAKSTPAFRAAVGLTIEAAAAAMTTRKDARGSFRMNRTVFSSIASTALTLPKK
jgi:hypothetical protein